MEIRINGKTADITLESEQTVGEVLAGIQRWLDGGGLSVSGLELDGAAYGTEALEGAFARPLAGLSSINVITSPWAELFLEALVVLEKDLEHYETLPEAGRKDCRERWDVSAPAAFLGSNAPELYEAVRKTLEGSFSSAGTLALIRERIRELEGPERELAALEPLVEETARRLEELPLDMQTGKDGRAAETIACFSTLTEKLFRLIVFYRASGALENTTAGTEGQSLKAYIEEFSAALRELIAAYENHDTVLVGDLSEYELAPRLPVLYSALRGAGAGRGE